MKRVTFQKRYDAENGRKELSIIQKAEEKDCSTEVHKSFVYHVVKIPQMNTQFERPQIDIRKAYHTKKKLEQFRFHVKGSFCLTHEREAVQVNFEHTLEIEILWKNKIFSPKKSEILT